MKAEGAAKVEDEDDDQVFRLTEITTREVSFVDQGANGHKFLLVKRSDEMSEQGKKVVTGENGELETEGAAAPPKSKPDVLSLTKAAKESLVGGVKKAVAGLAALQVSLEKATEVEEGEVPEEVGKALSVAVSTLVETFPGDEGDDVVIEKVGRKMRRAQMRRLESALKTFADLLKELNGVESDEKPKDGAKDKDDTKKSVQDAITEAVAKALEGGLAPVVETMKAIQDGVSANARKVEEIAKTTGGSRQAVDADDAPDKPPVKKKSGFGGGDLNASNLPESRRFD